MKKILIVLGTRPEAIKMAPVIKEFLLHPTHFSTRVCVTAQHRDMLDQVLAFFEIVPDYDLDLMTHDQNLYNLTADIITGMKGVLEDFKPDYVFVHGDTSTSMAAGIAAYYFGATLAHVEAGLRTHNKKAPFPEEINRVLTGHLADIHFSPTETAKNNLLREGISENTIIVTGNTVIDALLKSVEKVRAADFPAIATLKKQINTDKNIVLLTMHRRENHGEGVEAICKAILEISERAENVEIIYPVHKNPNIFGPVHKYLGNKENIKLIEPLSYEAFVWLMDKARIIITDSGGIQEEAPSLGKPVLVLRNVTERPEAVNAGTVIMTGTNKNKIVSETLDLLTNKERYIEMTKLHNPYGDGAAARKILGYMINLTTDSK